MKFLQKNPGIVFLLLACLCIGIRQTGYLFLLDDAFYSQNFSRVYERFLQSSGSIIWLLADVMGKFLPGWILQRAIYITTLFILGITGYRLVKAISPSYIWGAYFSGIFLMINPRVYARMMDGQILIPLAIAFLGLALSYLIQYKITTQKKYLFLTGICLGIAPRCTSHSVFFIIALLFLGTIFLRSSLFSWKKRIFSILGIGAIVGILNLHRILPALTQTASDFHLIDRIDQRHFQAFANNPGNTNVYLSTLGGFGFRGEKEGRFLTIQTSHEKVRLLLFSMIFICVFFGTLHLGKQKSWNLLGFLLSLGFISYVLGIGISGNTIFALLTQWLYDNIPLYPGLREPQKWIGLLMMVYAILGGIGVEIISKKRFPTDHWNDSLMRGFLLLLPMFYTPFQLFAGRGQLAPHDYPQARYDLRESIDGPTHCNTQKSCYDILVFPRHLYQSFSFTRTAIAHPMASFFHHQKVLVGDNMEMESIYTQSNRPESKVIERYIGPGGMWSLTGSNSLLDDEHFMSDLNNLGIHSIILLKEVDRKKYQSHLETMTKKNMLLQSRETDSYIYYHFQ